MSNHLALALVSPVVLAAQMTGDQRHSPTYEADDRESVGNQLGNFAYVRHVGSSG